MNIGMILDNEFTGDQRVENEVMSLINAGFNVFVLCFNYGNKAPLEQMFGGTIVRLPISLFKKNKMKGLDVSVVNLYTHFWSKKIIQFVKKYQIDVLHAHDLYMFGAAFKANKKLQQALPVVGDLHENYAAALKQYKFANTFPGKYIVSIPKWEKTEVSWVKKADYLITVIEEAKVRYENMGIPEEKIFVVANYVNTEVFLAPPTDYEIINRFKKNFVVLYSGGFDLHRGLDTLIRAIPLVKEKIPDLKLVLVGTGRNLDDLKTLADTLDVSNWVSFVGWQSSELLKSYVQASNVCAIPHLKSVHTDNTIPHKIFHYMILEKAVIASNCNPLERIVKETQAGLIFNSGDEESFASKLIYLYENLSETNKMGARGKKAAQQKYNWDNTSKNLVRLYENISQSMNK
ncbi:MAG: glycosyltransferase family 4 protein [Tenuifilaceae bacterium]|jgi:glycosyltransferase involved in cell wall biosynthesis|nr:glycosyltransferase family 4 protein [Tenuifilaceae bacterium]